MAAGLGCLAVMQQTTVLPNVISYDAVISACEKGKQWQRALGLLAVMQHAQCHCSAAISACGKGQQWQQVLGLLAFMQTAVRPTSSSTMRYLSNVLLSASGSDWVCCNTCSSLVLRPTRQLPLAFQSSLAMIY